MGAAAREEGVRSWPAPQRREGREGWEGGNVRVAGCWHCGRGAVQKLVEAAAEYAPDVTASLASVLSADMTAGGTLLLHAVE